MVAMVQALQRIQEWRDRRSSQGKDVGVEELSLVLAAVLSNIGFNSRSTRQGHTPIHALADMDKSDLKQKGVQMRGIVKLLKDCGQDIDTKRGGEEYGMTPLVQASLKGHFALVQGLVEQGADVNKCYLRGNGLHLVPLSAAASGMDPSRFGNTRWGSNPAIVSYLLKHGARVEGSYALHRAAEAGCPESVGILLKAGAAVNERDSGGRGVTPILFCCCRELYEGSASERVEALSLLLEAGADVNTRVGNGRSLLHCAASAGQSELIDLLVRRGLAVDLENSAQRTPLHFAAYRGELTCLKALIRLGAPLEAVDSTHNTPLHSALQYGKMDIAAELIDAGANVNAKRDGNITPLHLAAALGSMRLAYLLLEAGAEVDALTTKEFSPLMGCLSPAVICDNTSALIAHQDQYRRLLGWKEDREKVVALLLEMGAAVTKSVMALVGDSDCGDVVVEYLNEESAARVASDRVCNAVARHFSGSAYSEAAKEGRVVRVRLVDRTTGKRKETPYTLSIPLVELLMNKTEGEGGSSDGPDRHDTAAGSLPTMLDPAGRGFMGIKSKAKDEVEVTFDGVDFTEEGFAAVVQFVTTGSIKSLLTQWRHGQLSTDSGGGISGISNSSSETDGGSGSEEAGKRRGGGLKLFDEVRAEQALQAAGFFCIEAMSREVKALMTLYGFELAKETDDEPPRKGSREGP